MEDDIDIEEHDVLDNPRLRNIFPDLARLKTEVNDDGYSDQSTNYESYGVAGNSAQDPKESTRHKKINLGSRLTSLQVSEDIVNGESVLVFRRRPVEVKQEVEDEHIEENHEDVKKTEHPDEDIEHSENKECLHENIETIASISGSKTPDRNQEVNNTQPMDKEKPINHIKESCLVLEDWGPMLKKSGLYCKECKILFSTRTNLSTHNKAVHSNLTNNKAVKSTAKAAKGKSLVNSNLTNKAIKSTTKAAKDKSLETGRFCNHCNKIFPDSNSLISHLYANMTFDKMNGVFKKDLNSPKRLGSTQKKRALDVVEKANVIKPLPKQPLFYRCAVCTFYFKSPLDTNYLQHMLRNHSITDPNMTPQPFDGHCKSCKFNYPDKLSYNRHVYRKHLEDYKNETEKSTQAKLQHKYRCRVCHDVFANNALLRRHKRNIHPYSKTIYSKKQNLGKKKVKNMLTAKTISEASIPESPTGSSASKINSCNMENVENNMLIAKPISNASIPESSTETTASKENGCNKTKPLIPLSVLFKCEQCQINFISCTAAILHSESCGRHKGDWECEICQRIVMKEDRIVHRLQHQYSDKFTVYPGTDETYGRVLNKCPDCNVYFYETQFAVHNNSCQGVSVTCDFCKLPIHKSSIDEHRKWHKSSGTSREDVILVEFKKSVETTVPIKRKATTTLIENESASKKTKNRSDVKVFYCSTCKTFMFHETGRMFHIDGKCKKMRCKKFICNICGLLVTSELHFHFHKDNPDATLNDMQFFTIKEKRRIIPPIPEYMQCNECKGHYCRFRYKGIKHSCYETQKTCKYCEMKFGEPLYELHVKVHEYANNSALAPLETPAQNNVEVTKPCSPVLPELSKQYEMLANTWYNLYQCSACDVHCDSYDLAVEHCHRHFNVLESRDIGKHCTICDLKFDSICYEDHKDLHSRNKALNKTSFNIVTYKYTDVFDDKSWCSYFDNTLQNNQWAQIVARSIYAQIRTVKFRLVKDGAPELTIYRCGTCGTGVLLTSVANHYKTCCDTIRIRCRLCSIPFVNYNARTNHEAQHKIKKEFRVVLFNEKGDEKLNQNLRKEAEKQMAIKTEGKIFRFYVCNTCKISIQTKTLIYKHVCSAVYTPKRCEKCGLLIYSFMLKRHLHQHTIHPQMTMKTIKVFKFTPKPCAKENITVKLYKCVCGLHFISNIALEKHVKVCASDNEITTEYCIKCNRLFDTKQLFAHLCKHHSNDNIRFIIVAVGSNGTAGDNVEPSTQNSSNITTVTRKPTKKITRYKRSEEELKKLRLSLYSNVIYKCETCEVCLTRPFLHKHKAKCSRLNLIKCEICDNAFSAQIIDVHEYVHHSRMKLKREDLKIIVFKGTKIEGTRSQRGNENSNKTIASNDKDDDDLDEPQDMIDARNVAVDVTQEKQDNGQDLNESVQAFKVHNVIFKCYCGLYFLGQCTIYSHAKRVHENNETAEAVTCELCGLTFGQSNDVLARHKLIHHINQIFSRDDYYVVPYTKLDHPKLITTNHYYQCHVCNILFVSRGYLTRHLNVGKHFFSFIARQCKTCGYKFRTLNDDHVIIQHGLLKRTREDFVMLKSTADKNMMVVDKKIVEMSRIQEEKIAIELRKNSSVFPDEKLNETLIKRKGINRIVHVNASKIDFKQYSHRVYKCKCSVHFLSFNTLSAHFYKKDCSAKTRKIACHICSLEFTMFSLAKHVNIHHEKMKLTPKDIRVVDYNLDLYERSNKVVTNKLFRCKCCSLNFISIVTLQDHIPICKKTSKKYLSCNECNFYFTKLALTKHLKVQHKQLGLKAEDFCIYVMNKYYEVEEKITNTINDTTDAELVVNDEPDAFADISTLNPDLYTNKLYKCKICSIHFITLESLEWHTANSKHNAQKANCTFCGFAFTVKRLPAHVFIHHDKLHLTSEHFCVSTGDEDLDSLGIDESNVVNINMDADLDVNNSINHSKSKDSTEDSLDLSRNKTIDSGQSVSNIQIINSVENTSSKNEKDN